MNKLILSLFMFFAIAGSPIAQDKTITGTVTGKDDGLPMPRVSIKIAGSKGGAVTGCRWKIAIQVPSGNPILVFSSVGFLSQSGTADTGNIQ